MSAHPRWLTLDQIKAGEGAQDCGPERLFPELSLRRQGVEPARSVHVVMLPILLQARR